MTSRACRALLALALFLGAASLTSGGAHADQAPAAKASVAVGIGAVDPQIPDFVDTTKIMTFSGKLQNLKTTPLKNVVVELRRTPVKARSEMGSATGNGTPVYAGAQQSKQLTMPIADLPPGAAVDWQLKATEAEVLGGKRPLTGVYAIDVDVKDSDGDFLGGQRTYVVWKPVTGVKEAHVALLWPVVGMPGLTGQKMPNDTAAPIVSDPQAAGQFAPDGRLSKILNDGQQFPVNWILDPDVLYTANQLAGGYFVSSSDSSPKAEGGGGALDAKNWYDAAHNLFSSPQTQNCWNLPYADPDLVTLSHSQAGQNLLGEALKLHPPVTTGSCRSPQTVAWPAGGQADAATLKALQGANLANQLTLLSSSQVSSTAWKSAHVTLPQSANTVVYDTYLSSVFTDPAPPAGQPQLNAPGVLAAQEWLAQTALLAGDYTDRVLVVAPPRDFTPSEPLAAAISKAEKMAPSDKWVTLDNLGRVLDPKAAAAPSSPVVGKFDTPDESSSVVTQSSDSQKLYYTLHSIMDPNHERDDAVPFRSVATWWRTHSGATAFSAAVYSTVLQEHGLVGIGEQSQTLTLSGKSGTVPISIINRTNSAVHVYVQAHSEQKLQLKVADDQGLQTVASGQSATVRIRVEGEGNGQTVNLTATLYTCQDFSSGCTYRPTGLFTDIKADKSSVTIPVKVSRIGIIALGLMIGSGVLLVALIGLRVYRAKRAQHASAQDTMAS
ncbi:MAG: hypothetical protein HOW97_30380 [Catenulispora sp.]|nr:hypothetical protein [Catenulispora sp.]